MKYFTKSNHSNITQLYPYTLIILQWKSLLKPRHRANRQFSKYLCTCCTDRKKDECSLDNRLLRHHFELRLDARLHWGRMEFGSVCFAQTKETSKHLLNNTLLVRPLLVAELLVIMISQKLISDLGMGHLKSEHISTSQWVA